jgi:hypothetical protein
MASQGVLQNYAAQGALNQIYTNTAAAQASRATSKIEQQQFVDAIKNLSGISTPGALAEYKKNFATVITSVSDAYSKKLAGYTPGILASPSYTGMSSAIGKQLSDYGTRVLNDFGAIGTQVQNAGAKSSSNLKAVSQDYMQQINKSGTKGVKATADLSNAYITSLQGMGSAGVSSLGGTSERGATRLYGTLAAPVASFQGVQGDSAFSNMVNSTFMKLATKPPTVQSDVGSMAGLYLYNV